MYYAVDYNLHPQYRAYWIMRFSQKLYRELWLKNNPTTRQALPASHKAVKYAKERNAFYYTDRMVPEHLF